MLVLRIIYLLLFLSLYGCAVSYAPRSWLPETEQTAEEAYGGWLTVFSDTAGTKIKGRKVSYAGEFIGVDSSNVYVLSGSLFIVPKNEIRECVLELNKNSRDEFIGWTLAGALSTLSHGWYLILTFPAWVVTGSIASSGESYRDRYEAEPPGEKYWNYIQKFSRFPQGIPEGRDLNELKPRIIAAEEEAP